MWIVKLGGSLWRSTRLPEWLSAIAAHGAGRLVIVPGGGPFADTVREVQAAVALADPIAHRMALLGMCQYGLMLCGLGQGLVPARNESEIRQVLADGQVPVWLPLELLELLDEQKAVPEDWTLTADSLAAFLTARLGAEHLLLVKSVDPPAPTALASQLAREGIVDRALPDFLADARFKTWWLGPTDARQLPELLAGEEGSAARILP